MRIAIEAHNQLKQRNLTNWESMIWVVTSGNGVKIGTENIIVVPQKIQKVQNMEPARFLEVAVGAIWQKDAEFPSVTTMHQILPIMD